MRSRFATAAVLAATLGAASAHPGHSHSTMEVVEFAVHHWITGGLGFLGLGLTVGFLALRENGRKLPSEQKIDRDR